MSYELHWVRKVLVQVGLSEIGLRLAWSQTALSRSSGVIWPGTPTPPRRLGARRRCNNTSGGMQPVTT